MERLKGIEGNAFDLTLDEILEVMPSQDEIVALPEFMRGQSPPPEPKVFFGVKHRRIPKQRRLEWVKNRQGNLHITCQPGHPYLLQSLEDVSLPDGIEVQVIPRSSVGRAGGITIGTWTSHGFTGKLFVHFSIPCFGPKFVWERGARFASLKFFEAQRGGQAYSGIWSGEKTATEGKERAY